MILVDRWLKIFSAALKKEAREVLAQAQTRDGSYHLFIDQLYRSLQEYCSRGAGLGAILTLAVSKGFSQKKEEWKATLRAAVILDLFSKGILILDDIIDKDEQRMGGDAMHKIFSRFAEEKEWPDPNRFGTAVGMLSASVIRNVSQLALHTASIPTSTYLAIEEQLLTMQNNIDQSQLIDLYFENTIPTVEQWEEMAKKRGAAHVAAALNIGGLLNNRSDQDAVLLNESGIQIGYVYDIRADLLDSFGLPTRRRIIHRDFNMKKKPLFFCMAYKNAPPRERELLREQIESSPGLFKNNLPVFEKYGLPETLKKQREFGNSAIKLIQCSSLTPDAKTFFEQLINRALAYPKIPILEQYS